MCGIVGYIGKRQASDFILEGLKQLAYRGYDSAGLAVMGEDGIIIRKAKGKIDNLARLIEEKKPVGTSGIGHTRWATHGEPSERNAHPHTDVRGRFAVVHNGIIENYDELKFRLEKAGAVFASGTDTEVVAHLLDFLWDGDALQCVLRVTKMLRGSYSLGILSKEEPDKIYCVRHRSPLVAAYQNGEGMIASDVTPLLSTTRDVVVLQDGDVCILSRNGLEICDAYGQKVKRENLHVDWDHASAAKNGFAHFMIKEIHEQPTAIQKTFGIYSKQPELLRKLWTVHEANEMNKITLSACGTAYHAAVYGKYVMEKIARIPATAEISSEYRYREAVVGKNEWIFGISQSGETADTLEAMKTAKEKGANVLAITNTIGSGIAREAGENRTLYTYAGPEISVASTKAYTTQAELLLLTAVELAVRRNAISYTRAKQIWKAIENLPADMMSLLADQTIIQRAANRTAAEQHVFFTGRGLDYALALEAALKLKEVSYLFCEAYAAGELKHGPIALVENGTLVFCVITQKDTSDKMIANMQELKARGAQIISLCPDSLADKVRKHSQELITIPDTDEFVAPILAALPFQLLAYYTAAERGCDVDQPRNLAKSVTVE